ncbi:MAG: thiamine pyrophosphate-dependent enzyme [Thermoplasmata archaeon]
MTAATAPLPLTYSAPELEHLLGSDWATLLWTAYRWMRTARALDDRMVALQRQGRVGFYGPATGQEAVSIAAGLATHENDWVFPGLREQLVALVRGHPLGTYLHHLFADGLDPSLGRQMPCHPTAREVRYVSMSSCVGTQISHAVGCAYGFRFRKDNAVTLAFFGDGATSVNDFHAGMNFAGVYRLPVVFCCTNNQWAISLPVEKQSRVAELAEKGAAYGMPARRVDGSDFIQTYFKLAEALEAARRGEGPSFIEFVVYRMSAHSTSDDPSRYQPVDWQERAAQHDPVFRMEHLLGGLGLLSEDLVKEMDRQIDATLREAIATAERTAPPAPDTLERDVFAASTSAPSLEG